MFNFLASQHRQLPDIGPYDDEEDEVLLKSTRSGFSLYFLDCNAMLGLSNRFSLKYVVQLHIVTAHHFFFKTKIYFFINILTIVIFFSMLQNSGVEVLGQLISAPFIRRATSLELPMAMRFRHLKKTSKEAVGVYRRVTFAIHHCYMK